MFPKVKAVQAILEDQFTVDNVDVTSEGGLTVFLVKFPEVTVTNEHDESTKIYDLYVKIRVNNNGTLAGDFTMLKATYTPEQWRIGYRHSHLPSLHRVNDVGQFNSPCLGTGPLENTSVTLIHEYSPEMWGLFAYELSLYVTVESLRGGPYITLARILHPDEYSSSSYRSPYPMDRIPTADSNIFTVVSNNQTLISFIKDYLKNFNLRLDITNGYFELGVSFRDFVFDASDKFISYINNNCTPVERLLFKNTQGILVHVIEHNGRISIENSPSSNRRYHINDAPEVWEGRDLGFSFKGNPVKLHFAASEAEGAQSNNRTYLISPVFAAFLEGIVLKLLNYGYRNNQRFQTNTEEANNGLSRKFYFV